MVERFETAAEDDDDFPVLPENWDTVHLFMAVSTQWRRGGMEAQPVGLDYTAVDVAMRRGGWEDPDGELFAGLQLMEQAALAALSDRPDHQKGD